MGIGGIFYCWAGNAHSFWEVQSGKEASAGANAAGRKELTELADGPVPAVG